jgi:hypothetical protein
MVHCSNTTYATRHGGEISLTLGIHGLQAPDI